jgi:hypothetical protein
MIGSAWFAWAPLDELLSRLGGFGDAVVQSLPSFLLALLLVLLGWLLASLVAGLLRAVLRSAGFTARARSLLGHGALGAHDPAVVAASLVKWVLVAIAGLLAFDVLGFHLGEELAFRLRDALPRVVAAAILLVIGSLAAMLLGAATHRFFESAGLPGARLRGQVVTGVTTFFAMMVALEQLGFAAHFVTALGLVLVGTIGLTVALAVGLGCRELARDFLIEYLKTLDEEKRGRS